MASLISTPPIEVVRRSSLSFGALSITFPPLSGWNVCSYIMTTMITYSKVVKREKAKQSSSGKIFLLDAAGAGAAVPGKQGLYTVDGDAFNEGHGKVLKINRRKW